MGRTRTSRDGITPLMFACKHDHIDMVLHLLEFGDSMAIINWSDEMGNTALHYACQGGSPLLVEVLLMCGIKMPQRNNNGEMAIDLARLRMADDISNVMTRYTNRVKEVEIRMHFNSLIFPKEGEWTWENLSHLPFHPSSEHPPTYTPTHTHTHTHTHTNTPTHLHTSTHIH